MADYRIDVDVNVDDSRLDALESRIKSIQNNAIKINVDVNDKSIDNVVSSVQKKLQGAGKSNKIEFASNADKILKDINKVVSESKNGAIVKITTQGINELGQATTIIENLNATGKKNTVIKVADEEVVKAKSETQQLREETKRLDAAIASVGSSGAKVSAIEAKFENIERKSEEATTAVKELKAAQNELNSAYGSYVKDPSAANKTALISAEEKYTSALKVSDAQVKTNISTEKIRTDRLNAGLQKTNFELEKQKSLLRADNWIESNSIVKTKYANVANEIRGIQTVIEACDDPKVLTNLNKQLDIVMAKAQLAGQTGMNFVDKLKMQWSRLGAYFGVSSVIMGGMQYVHQMAQSVLEVDTAMTELKRVTDLTSAQYGNLYDNMIVSAKEYGATLTDIINSTADWSRAGFDADTANGLAEVTMMYQHIADLDYDEATENLLTAYKGFEGELTDKYGNDAKSATNYIADIFNELDNNYAVTAAGIGEAMRRSAASMDVANNSIEETVALITGGAEVTQDYEGVGNALKVVSMRLRGSKGELEEMGEEVDENVENLTKMQGQILNLTHGKVNIFKENGDFESTYEILQGIAEVWDDLTDLEQADLLETISGKHRANTVASIIGNWENVEASYASALNSTGSAAKENEKYMDSLQGRLNELTTAFQSFSNTAMSSGFLKGLVDMGSGVLNILDTIIDKVGLLPTLIGAVTAGFTANGKQGFFKVIEDESAIFGVKMTNTFKDIANIAKGINIQPVFDAGCIADVDAGAEAIRNYKRAINNDMDVDEAQLKYLSEANDSIREYVENTGINQISGDRWALSEKKKQLALKASNHSLANCNSIIKAYGDETARAGLTQAQYAAEVSRGNKVLGSYLSGLGTANGSLKGYIAKLVASKTATVALTAASMAMNAVLTAGIGFAISGLISLISKAINYADDLANKVSEATSSYKEQHGELVQNKSDFEALAESYAKLSKGVDSKTGKNISLMPSEYEEYQDVVNQIADTMPSLIAGYDAQGNAILNCAGDVSTLTDAYEDLIIAENDALLNGDGEDYKGISDISDNLGNKYADMTDPGIWGDQLTILGAEQLEKILKSSEIDEGVVSKYAGSMTNQIGTSLKNALEEKGIELDGVEMPSAFSSRDTWNAFIAEACKQHPEVAQEIISSMDAEMDTAVQEMRTAIDAHMENAFLKGDYSHIDDEMQGIAESIVGGIDSRLIMQLNESGGEKAVTDYVDGILSSINDLTETESEVLKDGFDLSAKFESGELSYGEYRAKLENAVKSIEAMGFDKNVESQLKLSLNVDKVNEQYDALTERLTSEEFGIKMDTKEAEDFLSGLSSTELSVAMDLIASGKIDMSNISADELKSLIQEQAKLTEAMSFTIDITAETEGIEALNTALAESRSATGLTIESMDALEGRYRGLNSYDAATLFQETANGISLNADALRECESEYNKLQLDETTNSLETMKEEYDRLTTAIMNEADATKKAQLVSDREDIRSKITDLAELASMYEGLTSSYNEWQNAESSGNDRDMYSNVHSAMEGIKDELDNGWIDDGTREYFQLIWGEDKWDGAGKSVGDYRKQWNTLDDTIKGTSYSIQDFFKTNEDGELTSEGIFNFFDAVGEKQKELGKDWIQYDDDGNIASFNFGVDGDKAIADALGISEELVQIFLRASQDAGFVVNFDGTYTQLADMQNEAIAAQNKFNEIFEKEYSFNFNTQSLSEAKADLEEAKKLLDNDDFWNKDDSGNRTTYKFEAEGATEAMQMVSTLQAMVDNLDNKYIGLTVEDESFEEPLTKLQDYENKVAELNQLKLDPVTNADEIESVKADMADIVDYFYDLDDETKKKIGIEVDATPEDIEKQINAGEIEIPTVLDIQTNMNENIEDLVKLSLYNSGMLTEDEKLQIEQEFKLKYIKSDDSDDSEDIDDKAQEDAENAGEDPVTVEQDVEFEYETPTEIADELLELLNGLTIAKESQKVVVEFVMDNKEEFEKLSEEERQVVVDLVANGDALKALEEHHVEIEAFASIFGVEEVDDLKEKLDGLSDEQIVILAEVLGKVDVEKLKTTVDGLDDKTVQAIAKALGEGDVEGLKTTINGLDDKTVQAIAEAFGYSDVNELNDAIDNLDPKTVQAIAQALGITDVDSLRGAIGRLTNKDVKVVASVKGKDQINSLKSSLANLKGKTITVWAQIKQKASSLWSSLTGGGVVDGTAHASGTANINGTAGRAFKRGDWRTKETTTALTGELGQELVVTGNRWYTVGDNGAEFAKIPKGSIVFNHKQTEELFKNGYVTSNGGRGRAFASGTAFSNGTGADNPWKSNSSSSSSSSKSKSKSKSSSSSSSSEEAEEFSEVLDWIEVKIDRIERAISRLDLKASSTFKKWTTRNSALVKEIAKVGEEIEIQNAGYDRYMQEAASVGLSSEYQRKVQNGEIDIETITDEDLKEKIDEYQQWYI